MQKIKLVDGTIIDIVSIEIVNGNLEIVISDKTAEEVQEIFKSKENLSIILLLTDDGVESGRVNGYVCYSGLSMFGKDKKVILTKETDKDSERITEALSKALAAEIRAENAESNLAAANIRITELEGQLTDTQIAIVEIYEGMVNE